MRIGHLSTSYHTSLILQGREWLDEVASLSPEWILFGGGPPLVDALENGDLDIGYAGLPPALIGMSRGARIKCVAGGHMDGTVLVTQSGYKTMDELGGIREVLEQFRGKKIGSPPKGSIHDVILSYLLRKNMVNVEVKNYDWADFIPLDMEKGEIEAAIGTPALGVTLMNDLGAKIAVPAQAIWPNNPSYGIIARQDFIEEHPKELDIFLSLHMDASGYIRSEPEKTAEAAARILGFVDASFVSDVYKISPRYCTSLPREFIETTMEFASVMKDMGYLSKTMKQRDIFETSIIEKIHPGKPHY
ncbi:MAG: ABC transporter substrate-binding protein [Candidatus Hydrothermarchaeales archaeon]